MVKGTILKILINIVILFACLLVFPIVFYALSIVCFFFTFQWINILKIDSVFIVYATMASIIWLFANILAFAKFNSSVTVCYLNEVKFFKRKE